MSLCTKQLRHAWTSALTQRVSDEKVESKFTSAEDIAWDEESDINTDDLLVKSDASILPQKLMKVAQKWIEIDNDFSNGTLAYQNTKSKSVLAIPPLVPFQFDYANLDNPSNLQLNDDNANAEDIANHREYMERLVALLHEVPKLTKTADTQLSPRSPTTSKRRREDCPSPRAGSSEDVAKVVEESEVVMSFAIHCSYDNVKRQQVEILAAQPLSALRDTIYCVQDYVGVDTPSDDCFFFIDGAFFVSCEDPSSSEWVQRSIHPIIQWLREPIYNFEDGDFASIGSPTAPLKVEELAMRARKKTKKHSGPAALAAQAMAVLHQRQLNTTAAGVSGNVDSSSSSTSSQVQSLTSVCRISGSDARRKYRRPTEGSCPRSQAIIDAVTMKVHKQPTARFTSLPRYLPHGQASPSAPSTQAPFNPPIRAMHGVRCGDIPFEMGRRYLFCHQGSCEHFLYLTDVRFRHRLADPQQKDSFPLVTYRGKVTRRVCGVCAAMSAKFVVYGDRLLERNPSYLCQHCRVMLHYSKDGQLLYDDYRIFPYLHDA